MFKTNKNSIIFAFGVVFIIVFVAVFIPFHETLAFNNSAPTYVNGGYYNNDGSYTFGYFTWPEDNTAPNNNTNNYPNNNNDINKNDTKDETVSNLAAGAIIGAPNSFVPSGAIQWALFAIIIALIILVVRKISGGSERYHSSPLKHK